MATVITVPRDSALQLRLVIGTNPDTGAPIINDVANDLIGLQKYTVDEIRFEKEYQLTE
jgi:hypothetical protein